MINLTVEETKEILEGLLAYRHHLSRRRDFVVDDINEVRKVTEVILKTDRIIHQLDMKVAKSNA